MSSETEVALQKVNARINEAIAEDRTELLFDPEKENVRIMLYFPIKKYLSLRGFTCDLVDDGLLITWINNGIQTDYSLLEASPNL